MNDLCNLLESRDPLPTKIVMEYVDHNIDNIKNDLFKNMKKFPIQTTPFGYDRRCLYRNEKYEILCLVWESCAESPIHNHAKNGCVMKLLKGELIEELFDLKGKEVKSICSRCVDPMMKSQYIDNTMGVHKISNLTESKTYSLHIYSPPRHKVTLYEETK